MIGWHVCLKRIPAHTLFRLSKRHVDAPRNRPRQTIGGEISQSGHVKRAHVFAKLATGSAKSVYDIAIKWRMDRPNGPCKAILAHHTKTPGFIAVQIGIGGNDGESRLCAGTRIDLGVTPVFGIECPVCLRPCATKLPVDLKRVRPERIAVGHPDRAETVDRHQCCHSEPVLGNKACRSNRPGMRASHGPKPGADATQRYRITGASVRVRLEPQLAIGRLCAPGLVAPIGQIVEAGGRHDGGVGHTRRWHQAIAPPLSAQRGAHAVGCTKAIDRAPRQADGINRLHQTARIHDVSFPGARPTSAHVHRSDGRAVGNDYGRAGACFGVHRMTNTKASDVCQVVSRAGLCHGRPLASKYGPTLAGLPRERSAPLASRGQMATVHIFMFANSELAMLRRSGLALSSALLPLVLSACGAPDAAEPVEEAASAPELEAGGMIAAAHPDAVEAGLAVLRRGGDAIDAAIAVQATLSLVEPQSSGIAGGAFMLRYDAETRQITVYDGRETAPASTTPERFLDEDGEPLPYVQAWRSGLSTGVPGAIAMFAMAHEDHGTRPWAENFEESIALAEAGFEIPPRLGNMAARMARFTDIEETGAAADYLFDEDGEAYPIGHVLTNTAYADSLRAIAEDWRNFYTGPIAEAIVAKVNEEPRAGGMTLLDLENYTPVRRQAICGPYRGLQICSAPPPSSGGTTQNAILGVLSQFDMAEAGPTVDGWHLFIEASRLGYADRDRYVADPDFADVPVYGLIDPDYLTQRATEIDLEAAMETATAGTPPGAPNQPEDTSDDAPGTSHFVVVDADGDVVSITTTVESPFGSGRMVGGFFLNNQLTDFARDPRDEAGRLLPNAPAPGKRPRSSMSPTIVLDQEGEFVFATGSPGGNSIIAYVAKSLVAMIDWGISPQDAAAMPNVVARGDTINIETGFDPEVLSALEARGFAINGEQGENSGIHIVRATEDGGYEGGADPRRDGVAREP